jgi:flagellar motor switch protein FliM
MDDEDTDKVVDTAPDAPEPIATADADGAMEAGAPEPQPDAKTNSKASTSTDGKPTIRAFDPALLSLMIGELGNPSIINHKCHQIQLSFAQAFMLLFKEKNGLKIEASAGEIFQGTRTELLEKITGEYCYCQSKIETWSDDIAIYCNNDLIIAIVECLLGGDDPENLDVISRPLSSLELDLSCVFFEIVNEALKAAITRNSTLEQSVTKPFASTPDIKDETYKEFHATTFSLKLFFGKLETSVTVMVPQAKIIKTDIDVIGSRRRKTEKKTAWAEKMSKQVYSSDILLQANIPLEKLRLEEVGRLQVGDVIRFGDEGDPTVILQANGRQLFNCALGKSGKRYMIKVEKPCGDEDWKDVF